MIFPDYVLNTLLFKSGGLHVQRKLLEDRLPDDTLEVGPSVPGGQLSNPAMVNVIMRNRPEQRLQDLASVILIRGRHSDVGVKTAWPGQCRVEDLRPIGGSNNNNPAPEVASEAVHLREKSSQDSVSG